MKVKDSNGKWHDTTGYWYTMDKKGVSEILHSQSVKSELRNIASGLCNQANSQQMQHSGQMGYMYSVKDLTFTSEGAVFTSNYQAMRDQEKYHTLNAINH